VHDPGAGRGLNSQNPQKRAKKRAKKGPKKGPKIPQKVAKNPPRFVPKRYVHNKKYETLDILLTQWADSSVYFRFERAIVHFPASAASLKT